MRMDVTIYDGEQDDDQRPLYERLAEMEQSLRPSRWSRLLMFLGLKRDDRLTRKPWSYREPS